MNPSERVIVAGFLSGIAAACLHASWLVILLVMVLGGLIELNDHERPTT